jgi:hypothetical protein
MEEKLTIYGSYQDTFQESVIGHNDTKYIVGGNGRYNLRNNTIEFELLKSTDIEPTIKTKQISTLLKLRPHIDDPQELCQYLNALLDKPIEEIIRFLEKSLDLKEPITIVLRKLFYILIKHDKDDKTHIEFCKLEPTVRIKQLLEALTQLDIPIILKHINKLTNLYEEIKGLVSQKTDLIGLLDTESDTSPYITVEESYKDDVSENDISPYIEENSPSSKSQCDLDPILDQLIDIYTKTYPTLEKIEVININISKNLEKICQLLG